MALYRAPAADALVLIELDVLTACYHRASGITHLLASPAPELLAILAEAPLDADALLTQLGVEYDLGDADRAALTARLAELVESGLIERA